MPSQLTQGKSPVGNFSFNLTNPKSMFSAAIQAFLGLTFLIVVAGVAWNQGAPTVGSLLSNITGGRVNAGRPGSGEGATIEVA